MKDLKDKLNKSYSDSVLDKSIKASEKKKVQNAIYKQLEKTGTTGKFYRDDAWEGVGLVKKDIEAITNEIKESNDCKMKYELKRYIIKRISNLHNLIDEEQNSL